MKNWKFMGEEPDYRFTLANERTFLAWIRTGLGFFVTAVALEQLGEHLGTGTDFGVLAYYALTGISVVCIFTGYIRWRRNEIAMRQKHALTYGFIGIILTLVTLATMTLSWVVL